MQLNILIFCGVLLLSNKRLPAPSSACYASDAAPSATSDPASSLGRFKISHIEGGTCFDWIGGTVVCPDSLFASIDDAEWHNKGKNCEY